MSAIKQSWFKMTQKDLKLGDYKTLSYTNLDGTKTSIKTYVVSINDNMTANLALVGIPDKIKTGKIEWLDSIYITSCLPEDLIDCITPIGTSLVYARSVKEEEIEFISEIPFEEFLIETDEPYHGFFTATKCPIHFGKGSELNIIPVITLRRDAVQPYQKLHSRNLNMTKAEVLYNEVHHKSKSHITTYTVHISSSEYNVPNIIETPTYKISFIDGQFVAQVGGFRVPLYRSSYKLESDTTYKLQIGVVYNDDGYPENEFRIYHENGDHVVAGSFPTLGEANEYDRVYTRTNMIGEQPKYTVSVNKVEMQAILTDVIRDPAPDILYISDYKERGYEVNKFMNKLEYKTDYGWEVYDFKWMNGYKNESSYTILSDTYIDARTGKKVGRDYRFECDKSGNLYLVDKITDIGINLKSKRVDQKEFRIVSTKSGENYIFIKHGQNYLHFADLPDTNPTESWDDRKDWYKYCGPVNSAIYILSEDEYTNCLITRTIFWGIETKQYCGSLRTLSTITNWDSVDVLGIVFLGQKIMDIGDNYIITYTDDDGNLHKDMVELQDTFLNDFTESGKKSAVFSILGLKADFGKLTMTEILDALDKIQGWISHDHMAYVRVAPETREAVNMLYKNDRIREVYGTAEPYNVISYNGDHNIIDTKGNIIQTLKDQYTTYIAYNLTL